MPLVFMHNEDMSDFRDYENGVADVLSYVLGDEATVERNVMLPGRQSQVQRQIDVCVTGRIFQFTDATMIVDCKKWKSKIDVADMGSFIGLVEDVGADFGLLMTSSGESEGARQLAKGARGIRVQSISIEELGSWKPEGTLNKEVSILTSKRDRVVHVLRERGFRVALKREEGDRTIINIWRHCGSRRPSGEIQHKLLGMIEEALVDVGASPIAIGHGVSIGGGTPGHAWLKVLLANRDIGIKICAASEHGAEKELDHVASGLGLPREHLSYLNPEGWPLKGIFDWE